jgi:hypothetical protein
MWINQVIAVRILGGVHGLETKKAAPYIIPLILNV